MIDSNLWDNHNMTENLPCRVSHELVVYKNLKVTQSVSFMYILNHPVSHSLIFQLPNNIASRGQTWPQWVAFVYTSNNAGQLCSLTVLQGHA